MSENKPSEKKANYITLALGWLGTALIVLGLTRWVTGIWSPEAAEYAGASNTLTAVVLIAVGVVMVILWALLRKRD
jgi:uncharacterized membrane protein YidH (DUF202 family)